MIEQNTHETKENVVSIAESFSNDHRLTVSHGKIAKNGDRVIDYRSKVEGTLRFSLWAWLTTWDDGMITIVVDPEQLILKD